MEEAADNIVPANCSPVEVDRLLNFLPEPLRSKILLKLPTKDVVELSEVCRRWRDLWKSVPGLDLGYADLGYAEDNLKILYVHSKSFLSLCFVGLQEFDIDEVVTLWIDAPKLHYLSIVRDATNWFKTKGFGALVKLDLDTNFNLTSSDLKSDDISKGSWRETIV